MVDRRGAIIGGLSAVALAAVGGAAAVLGSGGDAGVRTTDAAAGSPPSGAQGGAQGGAQAGSTPPLVSEISGAADASVPSVRVTPPVRVDWLGGSDVAWQGVSLPDQFVSRSPSIASHPVDMRTRMVKAAMAPDVEGFVGDAVADRTQALIMSINPTWLYWDEVACKDLPDAHQRYQCLLTPISNAISRQRAAELTALIDAAVATGVPVYVYTMGHSTDALDDPDLAGQLAETEQLIAGFDPQLPRVRFRSRIITRDFPRPMVEGVDFYDMVHPTPEGARRMGVWLTNDIVDFWATVDFPG